MAKPRDNRQKDLLRPALEDMIDLGHALVRLAQQIDWGFLDQWFSSVCTAGDGHPPLPTRLVAGLFTAISNTSASNTHRSSARLWTASLLVPPDRC